MQPPRPRPQGVPGQSLRFVSVSPAQRRLVKPVELKPQKTRTKERVEGRPPPHGGSGSNKGKSLR